MRTIFTRIIDRILVAIVGSDPLGQTASMANVERFWLMPWDMSYDDYPVTGNRQGHGTDDLYTFGDGNRMYMDMMEDDLMRLHSVIHPASQDRRAEWRDPDWHTTPSGAECIWCAGSDAEPADDDDAESLLCRGHLAEYLGESLASLDRAEQQARADMRDAGYLD